MFDLLASAWPAVASALGGVVLGRRLSTLETDLIALRVVVERHWTPQKTNNPLSLTSAAERVVPADRLLTVVSAVGDSLPRTTANRWSRTRDRIMRCDAASATRRDVLLGVDKALSEHRPPGLRIILHRFGGARPSRLPAE